MGFKYHRNDEALRQALETHTVDGMEVYVPSLGIATIIDQGATGPVKHITPGSVELANPFIYFRVKANEPVPFNVWLASKFTKPYEKMNLEEWIESVGKRGRDRGEEIVYLPMANYLRAKLEAGESISRADVEHDDLVNRGCITPDDYVTCYTFYANQAYILPPRLRRGEMVEYVYGSGEERMSYPGSILGFTKDRKIAYLELFTPMPFLELPDSIWLEGLEESFSSPYTHALGYGSYEALEIAEQESGEKLIPPGKWDTDVVKERKLYTLKEFIPISVVKDLCEAAYGKEPLCYLQSLIVYVVPILLDYVGERGVRGGWRPLPEKVVSVEAVISYEDEDEG